MADAPSPPVGGESGWPRVSDDVTGVRERIEAAGLTGHAADLDISGYTVVPAVLTADQVQGLSNRLVDLAALDEAAPVDVVAGESHLDRTQEVALLLRRGGVLFEQLVIEPRILELVTYLLGSSRVLSSVTGYVKGPGRCGLGVHSDTAYVPDPLPPYAQVANVNWLLSDYTVAGGCLSMEPGSHRYCHRPRGGHGGDELVPVQAAAGSAVVWHGNTWHSAFERTDPGVRLTISVLYSRMYMRAQENYAALFDERELATKPDELRKLIAVEHPLGWTTTSEAESVAALRRRNGRTYYRTRGQYG